MPVGFGLSLSNFVSGLSLVRDLIKALQDSRGFSKEYLQLIAELQGLETTLIQAKAQYDKVASKGQRITPDQAVQRLSEIR